MTRVCPDRFKRGCECDREIVIRHDRTAVETGPQQLGMRLIIGFLAHEGPHAGSSMLTLAWDNASYGWVKV